MRRKKSSLLRNINGSLPNLKNQQIQNYGGSSKYEQVVEYRNRNENAAPHAK
jgi:hypothetical protein